MNIFNLSPLSKFLLIISSIYCTCVSGSEETLVQPALIKHQQPIDSTASIKEWALATLSSDCMSSSMDAGKIALNCANKYFSVGGEPISPQIIKALTADLSDMNDPIISIDLIVAQHSNRFCCVEEISIRKQTNSSSVFFFRQNKESFGYQYVGKTSSGVHIILTSYSGGGSGVFKSLYFFTVTIDKALDLDENHSTAKAKRQRLILKNIGSIALGDRWDGDLQVQGDFVFLGKDQGIYANSNEGGTFSKDVKNRNIKILVSQ